MLAGMVIDGGLSWNGWTYRGLSNEGGLYGSGGATSRDTYEVYTVAVAFAGNAIDGNPVKAVAPAPDDFVTGRDAWIPGGRQIQVSAGAFQAGNTILGIGIRATDSAASIAGFSPTIRFDLDNDSFTAASFEKDSLGRTTTLKNDGRTSFSTYAEPGDFTVQFEGSASWRGSSINVREAATPQLPAATVQLPGGVGSGTSYDFAFRAFAQPAAKSYQMFLDMTAIPQLYGSVYGTFFPGRAGVGTIGDRVTVSLNGLGTNNVVFGADLTLPSVDLDVDSDNNGALDRSSHEDDIEASTSLPGVIVPVGGERQKMMVDVPRGMKATLAFDDAAADKVKVFSPSGAVVLEQGRLSTPIVGGPPQTFWIEAFAASASMADIAFTLTLDVGTGSGSAGSPPSNTIRATAAKADLTVDELPDDLEDLGAGAIVWRNSDFSRLLPHPDPAKRDAEPGLTRYAPDYSDSSAIDPQFASQFTPGRASFTPGLADGFDFQFLFDATKIALWTRESWIGFDEVAAEPGGWWKIPASKSVRPGPGDNNERIEFWIEGLTATRYGWGTLELWTLPKPGPARPPVTPPDTVTFTVVDVGLGVDGNRDGTIDFADSHDRQLTFWLNGDAEAVDDPLPGSPYELENPLYAPGGTKDSADNRIATHRDLEDFASLHFLADDNLALMIPAPDGGAPPAGLRPTYRYTLSLGAADTNIRLFHNRPRADVLAYVRDVAAAETLVKGVATNTAAEPEIGRMPTVLRSLVPSDADDRYRYLFEAFGRGGKAALNFTVTVTYPQSGGTGGQLRTTSRTHTLDLDLREIKDLYTRMQVPYRNGGRDDRFTHFVPGTEELPHFGAAQALSAGNTRGIPFLSGTETVVLVHGWNMTDGTQTRGPATDWKRAFAETAFKRLYWQGFRGNVAAFDWPTFADQEGRLQGDLAFFNFTYNASEYQAFRSGRSLMTFLADKKATGAVHLLAHSMGNVVAAEALRQWTAAGNGQALVSNYVAMQGALSAGAYGDDATDATDDAGLDYYRFWPAGWDGEQGRYYMQGTDQAAGRWINMFNEVDRATSSEFAWVDNNRVKPLAGNIWRDVAPGISLPDARRFAYRINFSGKLIRSYADDITGIPVTDGEVELTPGLVAPGPGQLPGSAAYEVLAFMSKANAKPIGTKEVDHFGTNIDISKLGLRTPYLAEWPGHSFQFHFDAATTAQFWKRVVDETQMDTVSKPRNP
jgi:hypothetical protein